MTLMEETSQKIIWISLGASRIASMQCRLTRMRRSATWIKATMLAPIEIGSAICDLRREKPVPNGLIQIGGSIFVGVDARHSPSNLVRG